MKTSRIPGFYSQSIEQRLKSLAQACELSQDDLAIFQDQAGLSVQQADHMVENAIGVFSLPLGLGLNFIINGREVVVPMAIEEPSVVAGASFMAKLARSCLLY